MQFLFYPYQLAYASIYSFQIRHGVGDCRREEHGHMVLDSIKDAQVFVNRDIAVDIHMVDWTVFLNSVMVMNRYMMTQMFKQSQVK